MKKLPFAYSLLKIVTNKYDLHKFLKLPTFARLPKDILFLAFIALVFFTPADFLLYAQNNHQKLRLVYNKKKLSISANDADIKNVLLKLAEEAEIQVWFPNSLNKKISIEIGKISLSEALQKLLTGLNYAIIYSGPSGKEAVISKVFVFKKLKKSSRLKGNERQIANRIRTYKRQIEVLKGRLSKIDANSSRAKRYLRQIKRYEENIVKLENQMY